MKTEIIYEDKDILVIYKPAGLATQTAKLGQADVVSELKNYLSREEKTVEKNPLPQKSKPGNPNIPYIGVIHRLDQPVEGLLVFAKNKKAASDLTAQLQKQGAEVGLHKHYYAVLCGKPSQKEGELVDYMYKSPENLAIIVERDSVQAKEARLRYKILEEAAIDSLVLADIQILTGRFHQIRAQMAHANLPLLGDAKYGTEEAKKAAQAAGVRTVALCAYSLEFVHPVTKKKMNFEIEPKGNAFSFFRAHEK